MHFLAALQRERHVADACSASVLVLWILFIPRINLSPFTKDFRGEDHHNESIDQFLWSYHQIGRQPFCILWPLECSVVGRLGMQAACRQAAIHGAVPLLDASLCPRLASVEPAVRADRRS